MKVLVHTKIETMQKSLVRLEYFYEPADNKCKGYVESLKVARNVRNKNRKRIILPFIIPEYLKRYLDRNKLLN